VVTPQQRTTLERPASRAPAPVDDVVKMRRRRSGRAVAGVAGGIADHLEIRVLWVRLSFALLAALGGAGVLAYGLLWVFVPQRRRDEEPTQAGQRTAAREKQQARGLIALGIGLAIGVGTLAGDLNGWVAAGLAVTLVGIALVWREADDSTRRRARSGVLGAVVGHGGRTAVLRVLAGAVLMVTGIVVFLIRSVDLDQMQFALVSVLVTLIGVAVLTVPFWLRLVRDLGEERRVRIRTEERAEIAAHLHDSVLQTLALIQKQSEAPREVLRLARGQERQLRGWLYGPAGYGRKLDGEGADGAESMRLAEAIAQSCGEVEDHFAIQVQQVVVGDCELDERLAGMVFAAREAVVNAAKHADVSEVSVYAEVEAERVTIFVRDRGKGFDVKAVPADRHGLADSIRGRMERNGGELRLRTAPGEGTEVALAMPRAVVNA
jgi:signal transduction histidine kinase